MTYSRNIRSCTRALRETEVLSQSLAYRLFYSYEELLSAGTTGFVCTVLVLLEKSFCRWNMKMCLLPRPSFSPVLKTKYRLTQEHTHTHTYTHTHTHAYTHTHTHTHTHARTHAHPSPHTHARTRARTHAPRTPPPHTRPQESVSQRGNKNTA